MQESRKVELGGIIKQQAMQLDEATRQQAALVKQLDEVQQRVTTISGSDAGTRLLVQVDFLVKLVGRKLWGDRDVITVAALLKSADASLANMNGPSLTTARRATIDDIASPSAMTQISYDGITLKVNQLSSQIDNLRLADNGTDDSPMNSDGSKLPGSINKWRVNLQKDWQNFVDSFIIICRHDETAVLLLAPNQDVYLREDICSRLLVTARAVPCHQEETYRWVLGNVSTWVRAYHDTDDAAIKAFLEKVDRLSQQSISMDVPGTLQSQATLDKLVQTRIHNLLAQLATAPVVATPVPSTDAPATTPQGEQ